MRIFIGIPVTNIESYYLSFQEKHKGIKAKWLNPSDLHITLIPPWKTENVEGEIEKLKMFNNMFSIMDVVLTTIQKGGKIITAIGPENSSILKMEKKLKSVFVSTTSKRELLPHVTLARSVNENTIFSQQDINWKVSIDKIALFESIPNFEDKRYRILCEIKLNE
ncbi:2'-5' RNA ligase family protein [Patescibacteria group bacterium]